MTDPGATTDGEGRTVVDWAQIWQWLYPGLVGLGTSNGGAWYCGPTEEPDGAGTPGLPADGPELRGGTW